MFDLIALLLLMLFGTAGAIIIFTVQDEVIRRKALVLVVIVILGFTAYALFNQSVIEKTIETEVSHVHNTPTFFTVIGWNGGYNPYRGEWSGTADNEDFDRDGVLNIYDPDADNDGVSDVHEYPYRFSPFEPDIGISHLSAVWYESGSNVYMKVRVEALRKYPDDDMQVTLFVDGKNIQTKNIVSTVDFVVPFSDEDQHTVTVKIVGDYESKYANKANNELSYTLPSGVLASIQIGYWYSNLETEIQGVLRNVNVDLSPTIHGFFDRLLFGLSSIPLFVWIMVFAVFIVGLVVVRFRRKTVYVAGRKPGLLKRIWNKLSGKKTEVYEPGDVEVKIRRF